jgi:hypothetical protein
MEGLIDDGFGEAKDCPNNCKDVLVYKIQQLLHSLIASLMWSFHCVDLRPVVG